MPGPRIGGGAREGAVRGYPTELGERRGFPAGQGLFPRNSPHEPSPDEKKGNAGPVLL